MSDSWAFAVDVFRTICDRLESRAEDLKHLVEASCTFEEWLGWEAFLACKHQQAIYPFCEVAAKPTYASEGVASDLDNSESDVGDLRVGASDQPGDHRWLFAEIVLLQDGNCRGEEWKKRIEADTFRLLRLGWKRSATLLIVALASQNDVMSTWGNFLSAFALWNQPALTEPFLLGLPGGGSVVLKAFDIKRDPAHRLIGSDH